MCKVNLTTDFTDFFINHRFHRFFLTLINADFYCGQVGGGLVNCGLTGRRYPETHKMIKNKAVNFVLPCGVAGYTIVPLH